MSQHILGIFWGYFWNIFGIFWGYFGDIFGIFWRYFGDILGIFWGHISLTFKDKTSAHGFAQNRKMIDIIRYFDSEGRPLNITDLYTGIHTYIFLIYLKHKYLFNF